MRNLTMGTISDTNFVLLFIVIFLVSEVTLHNQRSSELNCSDIFNDEFHSSQIILFFAPTEYSTRIRGQIAVYWHHRNFIQGSDYIGLYDKNYPLPIMTFYPATMKGVKYTGVNGSHLSYGKQSIYKEYCMGYYASWLRDGLERKTSCLSTHPNWMSIRNDTIGNKSLIELFIPGTHDSGAYSKNDVESFIDKYTVTQDTTVLEQLISGARYIDLRPAAYNSGYWVNHGVVAMNPMSEIIDQVKQFMDNTNEIVILDFKEFPIGFYDCNDHDNFANYLIKEFAGYLLQRPTKNEWLTTLNDIWKANRRLIISYNQDGIQDYTRYLWPSVLQQWGNIGDVTNLYKFLKNAEHSGNTSVLRAAMATITLTTWSIIKDTINKMGKYGRNSLIQLAVESGPLVTTWYNEEFYIYANIVAVDFIDASGIVEVAIEWNDRFDSPCYLYYHLNMITNRTRSVTRKL